MDFQLEEALLSEYVQWAAVESVRPRDTTPDAFLKDRMKQVAFDRVEAALTYIAEQELPGHTHPVYAIKDIKAILEGTYVKQTNDLSGPADSGPEPQGESGNIVRHQPITGTDEAAYPTANDRDNRRAKVIGELYGNGGVKDGHNRISDPNG